MENDEIISEEETPVPDTAEAPLLSGAEPAGGKFITPLAPRTSLKEHYLSFRAEKKYLLLCFLVPTLIMGLMYFCLSYYHGGETVLVLDLNGQYVYFYEGLRDFLMGDGSLLYSFSRALGGEFIGIFAYYISSPFALIVALFPKKCITEAILTMILLKVGCSGLTFGIYIEATGKERNRVGTVIFSTMYALCGYAVIMQHNTMWFDNFLLLPIIMLGIENLIKFGKFRLFVISLSMAIFSNFYMGYMTCIFCAVYFVYYLCKTTPEERNPRGEKKHLIKSFGRMALFSAVAVGICAALIIGTYYSLSLGKTTFSSPDYSPKQRFEWLDLLPKLFIGSYDTVRPEGLPIIYSGILAIILMPLYFFAPHINAREKISSGCLIVFFLLSFNVSTIDLFWHGLQRPNWLNYRYSYMLCFFIILFAYKAYERLREIGYRKAIAVCAFLVIILFILQKQDYEYFGDFDGVWLSVAVIGIYLCVLWAVCSSSNEKKETASLVLAILVGTEMFGAGMINMSDLDDDVVYSSSLGYRSFIDGLSPTVNNVLSYDESFYRMEKTEHRKTNDNYALNINGLSNSTSTLNSETIDFLHDLGLSSKSHWSKYLGGTPVCDTLLGIKYIVSETDTKEIFEEYNKTSLGEGDYTVWENPYALSLCYAVNSDIDTLEINEQYSSPFDRMNAIVAAMTGKSGVNVFSAATCDTADCGDLIQTSVAGHYKYRKAEGASSYNRITYNISVTSSDVLYCYFPSEYMRECDLYVNGVKTGSVFGNETDRIIELGSFEVGSTVQVELALIEDEAYIDSGADYFYYLNSSQFEKYMPLLSENQFIIDDYNDDYFKGTITVSEGNTTVFTSIPYDEGWNIYVDGEKVEPIKLLNGVIGFHITEGEHTLELKYFPSCLTYGIIIQLLSLAAFGAIWFFTEKKRKKLTSAGVPVYMEYPEPVAPDASAFDN